MAVKTNYFEWSMPDEGVDPWATLFYALLNEIDSSLLTTQVPDGELMKWGDPANGHYFQADGSDPAAGITFYGTVNLGTATVGGTKAEVVVALPNAGASYLGRLVFFQEKLWVCVEVATPIYHPLVRPTLVVNPAASRKDSEYNSIQAAITALPAGGGAVMLMPGTYTLANALTAVSNLQLIGLGGPSAVIIDYSAVAEAYGFLISAKTDVTVRGIKFLGATGKDGIRWTATADNNADRLTLEDCIFSKGKDAVQVLKSAGVAYVADGLRIRRCTFTGEAAVSQNAVYTEAKLQHCTIEDSRFTLWGQVAAQHTLDLDGSGVATTRWVSVLGCQFVSNGTTGAERDISVSDATEVVISGCESESVNGDGIVLDTVNRAHVSHCTVKSPVAKGFNILTCTELQLSTCTVDSAGTVGFTVAGTLVRGVISHCIATGCTGDGFNISQLDDSVMQGCLARGNGGDGFDVANCDRTAFNGCHATTSAGYGFNLGTNTYLTFAGCVARDNTTSDLNAAAGLTNSRLGFTLEVAPTGTYDATNGIRRSRNVPLGGFLAVTGTPVLADVASSKHVGWAFDGAAEEAIGGSWIVPENILPGSDIDFRIHYVGTTAPGAGDDSASFNLNVVTEIPGTTLIGAAGSDTNVLGQLINTINQIERAAKIAITSTIWGAAERNLLLVLKRLTGVASDDYVHDLHVLALEAEVVETEIEVRA